MHLPPDELQRSDPCRDACELDGLKPSLRPRPGAPHVPMPDEEVVPLSNTVWAVRSMINFSLIYASWGPQVIIVLCQR